MSFLEHCLKLYTFMYDKLFLRNDLKIFNNKIFKKVILFAKKLTTLKPKLKIFYVDHPVTPSAFQRQHKNF